MESIDLIANGQAQGDFASRILANGKLDVNTMRPYVGTDGKTYITVFKGGDAKDVKNYSTMQVNTTGTLRRDEWKSLDAAVLQISETRLNGINDLVQRGLVYNLANAMGTTLLESHDIGDALDAELTMDGVTRGQNDRQTFGVNYLPIPIIHADYEINARVLAASRSMGNGLDTSMAERAARKVAFKLEQMLFTATSLTFGGGTIYSYLNHPDRNTISIGTNWDDSSVDGGDILESVIAMKAASIADLHYGPWQLYIPTAYDTVLDGDFSTLKGTDTIRERILKVEGITGIKVIDTLPANNVLLVQMTSDVVRLVKGMGIQNVQWQTEGNFINKYKVMTIQVPQVRSDQNHRSGVVHMA